MRKEWHFYDLKKERKYLEMGSYKNRYEEDWNSDFSLNFPQTSLSNSLKPRSPYPPVSDAFVFLVYALFLCGILLWSRTGSTPLATNLHEVP